MSIKLTVFKNNGLKATYQQSTTSIAREVANKLVPRSLFNRGALILGNGNPYTLINPQQVACIEAETSLPLQDLLPPGIKSITQIADRTTFLGALEQRWGTWQKQPIELPGKPFEALLHIELCGGWERHALLNGQFTDCSTEKKVIENLFGQPVICIHRTGGGMLYINPSSVIRVRIYHSNRDPFRPTQLIPVDPEDI